MASAGSGTQSHPDFVMLGNASRGTKVVVFVRKDLVDAVLLVATMARAVVVEVGGCRVGGVYGKCGVSVNPMEDWLGTLQGWIGGGDWVLLGDWNAHHHTWSLDRRSGPGGRVLAEWVLERGAEVHFGEGGTFERRRGREVVQSRINFVVTSPESGWTDAGADWLLSDHSRIGWSLVIDKVRRADRREVVDWDRLATTLADEDERWYYDLIGETAYDKLLDLRRKHLKLLHVCGRSKRWWNGKISAQLAVVHGHRSRYGRNGEWVKERCRLRNLIRDGKRKCWEDFCTESGEKSPWEVVRWAKDPWRLKERMGRLRGADGAWLESEGEKVDGLVRDLFGEEVAQDTMDMGDGGECPYGADEVMEWVCDALSGTKNNCAAGPDGVGYRLIKAIRDTRLGSDLLGKVVSALRGGYIPDRWRDMRVVLIPKPGRDLTQTKNWRPLNLINCIGKLGEKVVANRIQEEGSSILHPQEYGSVRGRAAVDVLYRSVVKARQYLESGGSVGWAFWDVKGGFQNVRSAEVLSRIGGCGPLRCWLSWLERFMSPREFEVAWDGSVRSKGAATKGVPQGSPLCPVLVLVFMAPILEEMERRVKEEVGRVDVQFPSYVDDLQCGLDNKRIAGEEEDKRERMQDLVTRVQRVVAEVAAEQRLPLAADKEESMVLRGGCGRKKRRKNGLTEKVKWLGVILDDRWDFKEHWRHRIGKARSLLGALGGVGNSRWGMSPISWRVAYTGMVRAVASWGVEIGWRGQKKWRHEMTLLQNAAMRKTLGAVKGSSGRKAKALAAVEDVETFARAAAGRFQARTLCNPPRAGVGVVDEGITGKGRLSFGGDYWHVHVDMVDLGPCKSSTSEVWERAIKEAGEKRLVVYTDGSRDSEGRVGGGWHAPRNGAGSVAVGSIATVWDGEVAGIRQALRMTPEVDILVLSDSTAALRAIKGAARSGRGRTRDLVEVVDEVGRRSLLGLSTQFGWVKAHAGVEGNELADLRAKAGCRESLLPQITEGGVRAYWKDVRAKERAQRGL